MSDDTSRRFFMKYAAAAGISLVPLAQKAFSANDRINAGWIGTGSRGSYLLQRAKDGVGNGIEVVATCDTYTGNLNRGKDLVQSLWGNTPKTFIDFKDLLQMPGVDAVVIAVPEHLHYEMTMAALAAGKNIYVEKPLSHDIEQGIEVVKATKKAGTVVQVGTQNRSNSLYQMAKTLLDQGLLGDIHYVRAFWYRNSLDSAPAWRYAIPADASPQNTDWNRFLGPAPERPFSKERYFQWRLYWDYSSGITTDLMVHQTDITAFVCHQEYPKQAMASGGIYRWTDPNDDREVPDTFSAVFEYPDRFHVNYSCYFGNDHFGYGEQFCGNEGTIEVNSRENLSFWPESFKGRPPAKVAARKPLSLSIPGNDNNAVAAHIRNWIEAIRGEAKLIAPVEAGNIAAITGHLATLSLKNKKVVLWDPENMKYSFA
jgi:predicted dehydrogenase